jgi:putative redox protein
MPGGSVHKSQRIEVRIRLNAFFSCPEFGRIVLLFLPPMAADASYNPPHVIVRGGAAGFAQEIHIGPHRLKGDEPVTFGGTDTGPSPYDFLLAALGTCTSMTISLYARRRDWPLENVTVSLHHSNIHAVDCADCETKEGKIDRIEREIQLTGALTTEQRSKLLEIASLCPVHRTLTSEINIQTRAV